MKLAAVYGTQDMELKGLPLEERRMSSRVSDGEGEKEKSSGRVFSRSRAQDMRTNPLPRSDVLLLGLLGLDPAWALACSSDASFEAVCQVVQVRKQLGLANE